MLRNPTNRPRVRRLVSAAAAATATALLLAACEGAAAGNQTANKDASITVAAGDITTENFNPFSSTALQPTLGVIYEPLYWYNFAKQSDPTPVLASGFSWNPAGTELTIKLRHDVKWNDGQPFTAKDVAFTFNLVSKTPALNPSGLAATAKATSDDTAVLTFKSKSLMQEPAVLANQAIVPEHIWKDIKDPTTNLNKNPVGTGPFKVKSYTPQSFVLTKNEQYWEAGKPTIKEVRYLPVASADAASAALVAGKVDWASAYLPGIDNIMKSGKNLTYVNTPVMTTVVVTCSNAALGCAGPQTDPAVRKAIYLAMNREQLAKLAGGGVAGVGSPTMLLPGRDDNWIADAGTAKLPQSANADEAGKLLDAAGWTKGSDGVRTKDGKRLSLTVQTVTGWSDYILINDTLKQQLAAVGIELKPSQVSWNEWNAAQTNGKFQLSLDSVGLGASTNPYFTYDSKLATTNTAPVGKSASAGNQSRFSNPAVDAALKTAAGTTDQAAQKAEYAKIQSIIADQLPYIPVYVNSMLTEFNTSRATGWPTKDNMYVLPAAWKAWDAGIVLKTIKPAS
ncbi:peptide/nickel transport system substrate-binding protein [Kribbella sp. VKM Ac-2569]|uniref:ABC transporter substrate-binding protein n=1 Tax=Kribbella sp. VKM Ac-2569 TaxID=2512220 RepID=UPI00102B8760|nr:ABC transporter substrate-binding protein [Kribbella sp. VKM Ac-2569]RZT20502.1 peptide/nickel transport system substrate-binding protein [Kribbella sp. VKM Ac-2569]